MTEEQAEQIRQDISRLTRRTVYSPKDLDHLSGTEVLGIFPDGEGVQIRYVRLAVNRYSVLITKEFQYIIGYYLKY